MARGSGPIAATATVQSTALVLAGPPSPSMQAAHSGSTSSSFHPNGSSLRALALREIDTTSRAFHGLLLTRSEEHTSELQSRGHLVCRLLLEKKKNTDAMLM